MLAAVALKYMSRLLVARTQVKFGIWIKTTYMWNLLNADIADFHDEKIGALNATLTNQADRATATLIQVTEFIANLSLIAAYLVAAFMIGYHQRRGSRRGRLHPVLPGAAAVFEGVLGQRGRGEIATGQRGQGDG